MASTAPDLVGAIDQGTTGTRFMLFDREGKPVASAYKEHRQLYPQPGWVEHDALEIWSNTLDVIAEACTGGRIDPRRLAAIGVTNQRETVVLWDSATGQPVYNAIVWQDRRTADRCQALIHEGLAGDIRARTGLPVDPYFSATKLEWLLANVPGLRIRAEHGELRFGTIDTWLLWNLTRTHATDPTNASRTLLFNLRTLDWDDTLLDLFHLPRVLLPTVVSSAQVYGHFEPKRHPQLVRAWGADVEGLAIPVSGNLGDQQAALFGQACFRAGNTKVTVGTGSFLLRHTGPDPIESRHGMISTVAYGLPDEPPAYALEGSVFITGAAVQWLRDGLHTIAAAAETEALARSVPDTGGVYFVPAFAGLGAPHWNPYARGTLVGITGGTTREHIVRATLEAIAYQTRDVLEAMTADTEATELGFMPTLLSMDGGAVKNGFLCQFQADILGSSVELPSVEETTALGAAYAAGLGVGFWASVVELSSLRRVGNFFEPKMAAAEREVRYAGWQRAVKAALAWAEDRP